MADELITIMRFADVIKAETAKQKLADYSIKAVVTGQNTANTFSGIPAIASAELMVRQGRADEAVKILRENKINGDISE